MITQDPFPVKQHGTLRYEFLPIIPSFFKVISTLKKLFPIKTVPEEKKKRLHPAKRREKDSATYRFINQKLQRRNVRKDVRKKGVVRREREREKKGAYHGGPSPIKRILLFELNSIRVDRLIVRSRSRTCGRVVTSADPWPRQSRIIIGGTARRNARRQEIPLVRHECSPHIRRTIGQKG